MVADVLRDLAEDVRSLLAAGATAAAGHPGLRGHAAALRRLAASAPALAPLAQAAGRAADGAEPSQALLELLARLRPARAALAGSGAAGDLHPIPASGPWRSPGTADALHAAAAGLKQKGQRGYDALAPLAGAAGAGDLRLLAAVTAALDNPYGPTADLVAQRLLPAFGPALAPELRAGLGLRGKAGEGRRLVALAHVDRRAGRELCRAALREGSPAVRAVALRGLAVAAPEEAEREAVAALAGGGPAPLKRAALDLFRERRATSADVVPALIRVLKDAGHDFSCRAREALARQGPAAVLALAEVLRGPSARNRRGAIWVLGEIGPEAGGATEALVAALRDQPTDYSIPDCEDPRAALARIGPPARAAVPALREEFERGGAARFRPAEALVMITGDVKRYLPVLVEGLSWPHMLVRWGAAQALGRLGPAAKPAVPALVRALEDRPGNVCHHAAVALGRIGHKAEEVVPLLIDLAGSEKDYWRHAAVEALGLFGPKARAALPVLQAAARDRSRYVRQAVGPALAAVEGAEEAGGGR